MSVLCSVESCANVSRFTGPKVNIEHMMLGREGNLIDGTVQKTEEEKGSDGDSADGRAVKVASKTEGGDGKVGEVV